MVKKIKNEIPEIYFCSFGLKLEHITFETLEALKKMDIIFLQAFDLGIESFFKKAGIKSRIVYLKHPKNGDFSNIANNLILIAMSGKKIAVLTYGFPSFLNGCYEALMKKAEGKVQIKTLYAIGSLNPLLELAGISDLTSEGIHFFNTFLDPLFFEQIDEKKHIPCFILNPHLFSARDMRKPFLSFFSKLSKKGYFFYLVEAESAGKREQLVKEVLFKNDKALADINERASLFISTRKISKK